MFYLLFNNLHKTFDQNNHNASILDGRTPTKSDVRFFFFTLRSHFSQVVIQKLLDRNRVNIVLLYTYDISEEVSIYCNIICSKWFLLIIIIAYYYCKNILKQIIWPKVVFLQSLLQLDLVMLAIIQYTEHIILPLNFR